MTTPDSREHVTSGNDCWCAPRYFVPCDECDAGCWKCDGGKIWLTRDEADSETRTIVVVHNEETPE